MLRARGLTVRFGGVVPLDSVDFDVPERGLYLLVGPNGAGKTTFLNAVSRFVAPASGTLTFDTHDLLRYPPYRLVELGIARSFQKAELFANMSVLDNVLVGLHHARLAERSARDRARAQLAALGLEALAAQPAGTLAHGFAKLVDLARALVSDPRLLLLDEPFAGVTGAEIPALVAAITAAARERAVLMVEHHLELVLALAARVSVLDFGRKISEGTPDEVRRDPAVIRSYLGGKAVEHAW